MTDAEMLLKVKDNMKLKTDDYNLTISDIIVSARTYCNLRANSLPPELEPFVRKKTKGIVDYEAANGSGYVQEVQSIKEGDGTINWAQTDGNTRASIYTLTDSDKKALKKFRRVGGYA
ncbi:MAG: hypothetical protein RR466_00605 [Hungatella sp.]